MRYRVVVITNPELAIGFRLAGIEVEEAEDQRQAEALLEEMVLGSDIGLVAVNEDFVKGFSGRITALIRTAERPLIIPFPGREANIWKMEDRLDYVAALIRSAIGYHIKLTR